MDAVKVINMMDDTVQGFKLMVDTVEEMERLSEKEGTELEVTLLGMALELVVQKVDKLLGEILKLESEYITSTLRDAVADVIRGKEHYVLVAMILGGKN